MGKNNSKNTADSFIELKEEFVPLKSRIWVSAADGMCGTLSGLIYGGGLTYYFTRWRGLDPKLAAIVWLLFGIWNAVNDPLFGYISDRTKSKLGRRIPYIRYGAPLYAVAFIICWLNWPGTKTNQTAMFIQMLVFLFIYDSLYTAIATAIYIMPYEMAVSNKARSKIFIWKIVFSLFSTVVPLILLPLIQPGPGEDAGNFRIIMIVLGIVLGFIIFLSTYFYSEKQYNQEEEALPFIKSIGQCFKNFSFVIFETISFTIIYVQAALMQGVLYYFDELKVSAIPLYGALAVGIIAGISLWLLKRDIWGIKKCMRIMCLMFAAGCFIMLGLGRYLVPSVISFFFVGTGFSGGMYLIPLMNGDVIDMDEKKTGLRREGMYAGVNSFITKPALSIAQAIFLGIISWFGYNQNLSKGMQLYKAQTGILFGWMLVPGILLIICFILLNWYPLSGPSWDETKKKLEKEHKEKEKKYMESHGF